MSKDQQNKTYICMGENLDLNKLGANKPMHQHPLGDSTVLYSPVRYVPI